ncbi:MAG: PEP-CTERM sorting domain-containing protein [Verrucomicrobiota bacterium]
MKSLTTVLVVASLVLQTAEGMIHFNQLSSDPVIISSPTGAYADSGWQWQGDWGNGNGTIVSPNQILTANHFSATSFVFNGNSYDQVSSVTTGDMKLVTLDTSVHGDFSSWASFYRGSSEVGEEFTVFGQGRARGSEVNLSGDLKGWRYGTDGTRRWGTNVVDSVFNASVGPLLVADFDSSGGTTYETHLATWDSGGGSFIEVDGEWLLIGVNFAVDAFFNTSPTDTGRFQAALFDIGGYYLGSDANGWTFTADLPLVDVPSRFYMHRVSEYETWLDNNIVIPEPSQLALVTGLIAMCFIVRRRNRQT